jgi:peptidoglycan/xylan/chitin deacetylase (PgdA/CDA1 family)
MTGGILDILDARNAKAVFFLIGDNVSGNEDIVKDIVSGGHEIGIHSNCHRWFFPLLGKRRMTGDLSYCKSLLDTFSDCPVKLFRPPFGVTTPNMSYAVKYLGLNVIGWDIRTFDTVVKGSSKEKSEVVLKRVSKRLRPGSVILLHDRLPYSCAILSAVLDYLDSMGYKYDKCIPVR